MLLSSPVNEHGAPATRTVSRVRGSPCGPGVDQHQACAAGARGGWEASVLGGLDLVGTEAVRPTGSWYVRATAEGRFRGYVRRGGRSPRGRVRGAYPVAGRADGLGLRAGAPDHYGADGRRALRC